MQASEIITIVIGIFNLGALIAVAIQTSLTRRSVQLAEIGIKESHRSKEIASIPRAYLINYVAY